MALADYALVSLAEAKLHLGIVDTDRDTILESLIDRVSSAVLRETGREYAPASAPGETRTLMLKDGASVIDLYPYEARAVTAIVLAPGTDSEYTVPAGDSQLEPITSPDGVYDRIRLANGIRTASKFGKSVVAVTGTWGWASVPEQVKGWVLEMVEDRFKQDHAFYADADGFIQSGAEPAGVTGPVTIPYRIRDEMEAVRRVRIGSV